MDFFKKYKNIFINFGLAAVLVVLDQVLKKIAVGIPANSFSILGFSLQPPIKNYGFFFGLDLIGNDLLIKPVLTAVFLLFLFYYIVFLFFTPKNFYYLRMGLSVVFAGFSSNLINKIINFYVLDFMRWSPFNVYFNFADIAQAVGWMIILYQLLVLRKYIWKKNERRKSLLIMKKFQIQFLIYCSSIFLLLAVFFALLNYQFIRLVDLREGADIKQLSTDFFSYCFFVLIIIYFSIGLFFLYISNKIFCPIYAFERHIRKLLEDKKNCKEDFILRQNDLFKGLETLAKDIKNKLK